MSDCRQLRNPKPTINPAGPSEPEPSRNREWDYYRNSINPYECWAYIGKIRNTIAFSIRLSNTIFQNQGHPSCPIWLLQRNALPCVVLICLVWHQTKHFHTLMTVSNTGCNRYAQCPCGILHMYKVWEVYWQILVYWKFTKARQSKTEKYCTSQIARIMGPTWGPPGPWRPQAGPM